MWVVFLKPIDIKAPHMHFKHDVGHVVDLDERRAKHYGKLGFCEPCPAPLQSFADIVPAPNPFVLPVRIARARPRKGGAT